jgi:HD-GYP domain-containing protein (c-di-GMP phosphodiesterase class II)
MAAADTLDALTSNRSYHKSRSVAEAIKIIVDSSSYDFDPKVVEGLVSWLEKISNQLGKEKEQLTPGDLVGSQERLEHSPAPPVVVGPSM